MQKKSAKNIHMNIMNNLAYACICGCVWRCLPLSIILSIIRILSLPLSCFVTHLLPPHQIRTFSDKNTYHASGHK